MGLKPYMSTFNLSFFKRLGFSTKKDGEAILSNKDVKDEVMKIDSEFQSFQFSKQDQLYNFILLNFKHELSNCLGQEKLNAANRKKNKIDSQKLQMKQELIEEIKQDTLISEYPDLVIVNDIGSDLKKKFFDALILLADQKKMTPEIYNQFLLMKSNYEACFEILTKIHSFLDAIHTL
jgi:hypothetical protein